MPRGRKKASIVEKDFDKLIAEANKKIEESKSKIEIEKASISEQKKAIKSLEKEKIAYEKYKQKIDEEAKIKELLETIKSSGKSIEEIEAFVKSNKTEKEVAETVTK